MTKTSSRKGFTLIELLVVISIISLLSSVVLASLNSARAKARDAQRSSSIKQVRNALEFYYDKNWKYPTAADVPLDVGVATSLVPQFIAGIPTDPKAATPYRYYNNNTTNANWYVIKINYETKTPCYIGGGSFTPAAYWGLAQCQ